MVSPFWKREIPDRCSRPYTAFPANADRGDLTATGREVDPKVMPCLSMTNTYTFHGLSLAVSGDAAVSASLHARLRHFARHGHGPVDLRFEFYRISGRGDHVVEKPLGWARPVYEPPVGEVVYVEEEDRLFINYGDRVRVLCDPGQGSCRFSIRESEEDTLWLASHPLFTIPFIELLKRRRRYSLHAAGLCLNGQGLLFPGTSGSGKSTLTIALLRAGFGFLGDDMLFLTLAQKGLRVLAFPDEIDVTDETAGWFPELHHLLQRPKTPGWPKRPVWAEDVYGAEVAWECQPAVLVFPRVANAEKSVLKPMDRGEALLDLAPNVLLTEARSSQAHLDVLAQLARETACYRLEAGRDVDALPRLLKDLVT